MTDQSMTPIDIKKNRKIFLLMVFIFALPQLAALFYFSFKDDLPLATNNHGDLIQPVRSIKHLNFYDVNDEKVSLADFSGKWIIATANSSLCEQDCINNLYSLRQIRKAVANERSRVERLLVITDTVNLEQLKQNMGEYEGMKIVAAPNDDVINFAELAKNPNPQFEGGIYIIDPMGNLMMSYPPKFDPKLILEDLHRLLDVSQIG